MYFKNYNLALYGCLFQNHQEAAFANYRLFESIGFLVAFGYAAVLSTAEKLYIVLAFLLAGIIGYVLCEIVDRKQQKGKIEDQIQTEKRVTEAEL